MSRPKRPVADTADRGTRKDLMKAALTEFSLYGYDGARLERIAEQAGCAKRMIYYYFGNKADVYQAVLEYAYAGIRASEHQIELDALPPREALQALARRTFEYHEENVAFTQVVLHENARGATALAGLSEAADLRRAALEPIARILDRGVAEGVFRAGVAPVDVHFAISAVSAFRVDHAHTWNALLQVPLLAEPARGRHLTLLFTLLDAMLAP